MKFLLVASLLSLSASVWAQGYYWESASKKKRAPYYSFDLAGGLRQYHGDIQNKGSLFNPLKPAYGLGVRYQFNPRWGTALQLSGRGYAGKADRGAAADAVDQMQGKLWDGNLSAQFNWLRWEDFNQRSFTERDPVTKLNLFVGTGFGASLFNSSFTSRYYKSTVLKDSLGKDTGSISIAIDNSGSAGGVGLYVPATLGFRYRFNPSWHLGFEFQHQFYLTKNVDALSSKKSDAMSTFMVRLGYTLAQKKRAGKVKARPKK